jgi:hypothetical protein
VKRLQARTMLTLHEIRNYRGGRLVERTQQELEHQVRTQAAQYLPIRCTVDVDEHAYEAATYTVETLVPDQQHFADIVEVLAAVRSMGPAFLGLDPELFASVCRLEQTVARAGRLIVWDGVER